MPATDSDSCRNLYALSSRILDCIDQFVLTGDANQGLRSQLAEMREAIGPDLQADEAARVAEVLASILETHRAATARQSAEQLMESRNLFAALNDALVGLSEGKDRDFSRLTTIQESLQRTAAMRDMASLKASLAETVQFIKTETAEARQTAALEMGKFEAGLVRARGFLGATRLPLAGRPEGVREISHSLQGLAQGEALYLVAYLFDRLAAIAHRYGPSVTDELMARLIAERLTPLAASNTTYRWTPSSLVTVFSRPRNADKLRGEVANLNRTPLVHKMMLAGRTAVLTASPSHLVAERVSGSPESLIEEVDRFTLSPV